MPELWLLWVDLGIGAGLGMLLARTRYLNMLGPVSSRVAGGLAGAAAGAAVFGLLVVLGLFSMMNPPSHLEQIGMSIFLLGGAAGAVLIGHHTG